MNKKYILILNYNTGELVVRSYDSNKVDDIEEHFKTKIKGDVSYMCVDELLLDIKT